MDSKPWINPLAQTVHPWNNYCMMLYMHTFTPIDDPSVGGYFMDGLASESFGLLGWVVQWKYVVQS